MRRSIVFLKNALILCVTSVSLRVIGIVFNAYLIKVIGTSGMGLFQLVMSVYMMFVTLAYSGINMATTRLVAEKLTAKNHAGIQAVMRKSFLFSFVSGCAACLAMYACAPYVSTAWLGDARAISSIRILVFSLPFIAMSSVIKGYFTAVRRVYKTSVVEVFEQLLRMGLTVYLLLYVMPQGLEYAFIAIALSDAVAEVLAFLLLYGAYAIDRRRYRVRGSKEKAKTSAILQISIPVGLNSCLKSALNSVSRLLVPSALQKHGMQKEEALGQYGIIQGMIFPILQLPEMFLMSFASLLIPEFAEFYQKKDKRSIQKALDIILRATFLFSIGVIGVFSCFSDDICVLVYSDASVGIYLAVLAPFALFLYLDRVVDSMLTGLHQQLNSMFYNLAESVLTTILILLIVPRFGIWGYIAVLFIGKAVNMWFSLARLAKVSEYSLRFYDWVLCPGIAILLAGLIVSLLHSLFALSWWLLAALLIMLYVLQLWAMGCLKA